MWALVLVARSLLVVIASAVSASAILKGDARLNEENSRKIMM
jgi:hypothetical protein